jgi:hypothetical protein
LLRIPQHGPGKPSWGTTSVKPKSENIQTVVPLVNVNSFAMPCRHAAMLSCCYIAVLPHVWGTIETPAKAVVDQSKIASAVHHRTVPWEDGELRLAG